MNINEIIEELKTFSDEDVIKFNTVFSDFYKPYKKKENEIKKKLKKQKEELKKAEAIKAGDKLCEIYGINAYPISIVHKSSDCPYNGWLYDCIRDDGIISDLFDNPVKEYTNNDIENIENTFYEYFYNFMFDEDKDSRELRPGRSLYRVYVKNTNGEIKDIDEDEIRIFMQG